MERSPRRLTAVNSTRSVYSSKKYSTQGQSPFLGRLQRFPQRFQPLLTVSENIRDVCHTVCVCAVECCLGTYATLHHRAPLCDRGPGGGSHAGSLCAHEPDDQRPLGRDGAYARSTPLPPSCTHKVRHLRAWPHDTNTRRLARATRRTGSRCAELRRGGRRA